MTNSEATVIQLLTAELTGTELGEFAVADWDDVIKTAVRHAVVPLLYCPIKSSGRPEFADDTVVSKFKSAAILSAVNGERLMAVQDETVKLLRGHNIPCSVLKGSSVAVFYPHPELRQLGDIDILVPDAQLGEVRELMAANGYAYSSEHDFHVSYSYRGVHIEFHNYVTNLPDNPAGDCARKLFTCALDETDTADMDGYKFPVLCPRYQLLTLLLHMARHMLSSGIGLRQLCDWYTAVERYRGDIDEALLTDFKRCGVYNYAAILTQCCVVYMKMAPFEWCGWVSPELCGDMLAEILNGGNMNQLTAERSASTVFIDRDKVKGGSVSFISSFINSMNQLARSKYPAASRILVLRPFIWLIMLVSYGVKILAGRRKKFDVAVTVSASKRRLKLYNRIELFKQN